MRGAIAVTLIEWAGPGEQRSVIDWTVVRDEISARRFGSALAEAPRLLSGTTAIGDAIAVSAAAIEACNQDPEVSGMAAAWPYCDAVVSAHSLDALDDLLAALAR